MTCGNWTEPDASAADRHGVNFYRILTAMILIAAAAVLLIQPLKAAAANQASVKDGSILFATDDTIATSGTRWAAVGFHICTVPTYGNPFRAKKYATIYLKDTWRKKKNMGDGTYHVTFTIPKQAVDQALAEAGMTDLTDGGVLYLNTICEVLRNGVPDRHYYHTLADIRNAAAWRNPKDFADHFDVRVIFQSGKYPVSIEYRDTDGKTLAIKELPQEKAGKSVSVSMDLTGSYHSRDWKLLESYYICLSMPSRKENRKSTLTGLTQEEAAKQTASVPVGGIRFIAVMISGAASVGSQEDSDLAGDGFRFADGEAVLEADERDHEAFLAASGIPSGEPVYANVFVPSWLASYRFQNKTGSSITHVTVTKSYLLYWTETGYDKKGKPITLSYSTQTSASHTYQVKRSYSYWIISELKVSVPDSVTVKNSALPHGQIVLNAALVTKPDIVFHQYPENEHLKMPDTAISINLPQAVLSGSGSAPSVPAENWTAEAEQAVNEIQVRNDSLRVNGSTVMDGAWTKSAAGCPADMPVKGAFGDRDLFYQRGIIIPSVTKNGWKSTEASAHYKSVIHAPGTSAPDEDTVPIESCNDLLIHTPVVCDAAVQTLSSDVQVTEPKGFGCKLILGRSFSVLLPTVGLHKAARGYYERDYAAYTRRREVKFPFDLYRGSQLIPADTWIMIGDRTEFLVPTWVKEGSYEVSFRALAVNCPEGGEKEENLANFDWADNAASDTVDVDVSGQLYGFQIYDITDYPRWEPVYHRNGSLTRTGFVLAAGKLPAAETAHPLLPAKDGLALGYVVRFSVDTIGSFSERNACVILRPAFHIIAADGSMREADLYYLESSGSRKMHLIKVGSKEDADNIRSGRLGDPRWMIPVRDTETTAFYRRQDIRAVRNTFYPMMTHGKIVIPTGLSICRGLTVLSEAKLPLPADRNKAAQSCSRWYGEYVLPGEVYAVEKGYDLASYAKTHPLTLKEPFWIRKGLLLVSFDIRAVQESDYGLSYKTQRMDRWIKEGYQSSMTAAKLGLPDSLEIPSGAVLLYRMNRSVRFDYTEGGTH